MPNSGMLIPDVGSRGEKPDHHQNVFGMLWPGNEHRTSRSHGGSPNTRLLQGNLDGYGMGMGFFIIFLVKTSVPVFFYTRIHFYDQISINTHRN